MANVVDAMLKVADAMTKGLLCSTCGSALEPGEKVYLQEDDTKLMTMPKNGKPAGVPVLCAHCK